MAVPVPAAGPLCNTSDLSVVMTRSAVTLLLTWFCALIGAIGPPGATAAAAQGVASEQASIPLRLAFDRPIDGTMAPFVLAATKGLFGAEGLSVSTDIAKSPDEAIARVADGSSTVALVDINALIRFRDTPNAAPVKAVYMLFDAAPYAIIARRSRGITTLSDLPGKTLGVATDDLSIRMWPALAARNGIAPGTVKRQPIGAAVREPMLVAGQVDAVTGFSYLSGVNLRDHGIQANDLVVLRFADYGSPAYGAALIVNPKFAAEKPDAVRAFLRAVIKGLRQTIRDPGGAIDAVMAQMNGGTRAIELERLRTALRDNIVTADVHRNGFGAVNMMRLARAIDDIGGDHKFRHKPAPEDIFDPSFLPPAAERELKQAAK